MESSLELGDETLLNSPLQRMVGYIIKLTITIWFESVCNVKVMEKKT